MKKLSYIMSLLILCFSLYGLEKTGFNTLNKGTLKVGTSLTNPPFVQMLYGQRVGFEVDLMDAICKILNLKYELVDARANELFSGLENQKYDVIMGGLAITETRQRQIDFSTPYMNANLVLIISKLKNPNLKAIADLKGKVVGVLSGTSDENPAQKMLDDHLFGRIMSYPFGKLSDAIKDLEKGQIDAVMTLSPVANSILKTKRSFTILGTIPNVTQPLAFGFSKKNPELLAVFNKALTRIQDNGTYAKIYKKWFKESPQGESPKSNL